MMTSALEMTSRAAASFSGESFAFTTHVCISRTFSTGGRETLLSPARAEAGSAASKKAFRPWLTEDETSLKAASPDPPPLCIRLIACLRSPPARTT